MSAAKMPSRVAMRVGRSMIALTSRSAASSGVSVGTLSYILVGEIIGVFTSGMLMVVKLIPLPDSPPCAQRLNAYSAAFDVKRSEENTEETQSLMRTSYAD